MNITTSSPTAARIRPLLWAGTALAVVVLSASLVWLVAPELSPYAADPNPAPIHHLFGDAGGARIAAVLLQAAVSAAASAIGLIALFSGRRPTAPMGVIAVTSGALGAIGLIGLNGLAISGYTLAHGLPFGILALLVIAARTRVARVLVALVAVAAAVLLLVGPTPMTAQYRQFGGAVLADPVRYATPLAMLLLSGVWILIGVLLVRRAPGPFARFVLRRRIPITIVAACCALPYVVARLSWLTPWRLAGDPADYADDTLAFTTGMILGAAMLTGGILTLGLILPWGERLPRWFGRVGGRPVPVPFAVIPASIVAILFTTAGLDSLLLARTQELALAVPLTAVLFPFWLWGPMLALAAWGYALHRGAAEERETRSHEEAAAR
ncbi:hypothetical protein [Microbacterium sp. gxy059]|uniref:hypothetical protein n=1 Tax=Microbacterium sp. gxy059 TaxID=2957199 RepID=UPI003D98AF4D